jgi:hypothetical protein
LLLRRLQGYGFNYDLPTGTSKPLQSTYFMGPTSAYCTDACQVGVRGW